MVYTVITNCAIILQSGIAVTIIQKCYSLLDVQYYKARKIIRVASILGLNIKTGTSFFLKELRRLANSIDEKQFLIFKFKYSAHYL